MARVARTSGSSMGPLHLRLYAERLPTLLRCSGHQETPGSNAAVSALKSGELSRFYLEVAMISCDQKRGGMVKHFSRAHGRATCLKLHDAAVATIDNPSVQARLKEIGVTVVAPERRSREYLQKNVASEIEKWAG